MEEYGGWRFGGKYHNPGRCDLEMSFHERQRLYDNNPERYGLLPTVKNTFYMYGDGKNADYGTKDYLFYRPDGTVVQRESRLLGANQTGFFRWLVSLQ
mmetsp:Transcript_159/g.176  ORF Transcript_159/g.176 Transcript_159/m.176 type:complete len:98 (+) Transcript_159:212-505(+)